jgi:hypothetical protein
VRLRVKDATKWGEIPNKRVFMPVGIVLRVGNPQDSFLISRLYSIDLHHEGVNYVIAIAIGRQMAW